MSTPAEKLREAAARSQEMNEHVAATAEQVRKDREKAAGDESKAKGEHGN